MLMCPTVKLCSFRDLGSLQKEELSYVQGSAKEWSLGCMNHAPWPEEARTWESHTLDNILYTISVHHIHLQRKKVSEVLQGMQSEVSIQYTFSSYEPFFGCIFGPLSELAV